MPSRRRVLDGSIGLLALLAGCAGRESDPDSTAARSAASGSGTSAPTTSTPVYSSPAVADDTVYVGSRDSHVYALVD